jgi:hypothetical protein
VSALFGCSKKATEADSTTKTEKADSKVVVVEKDVFDVKLNLPASLFEGKDLETVKKDAIAEGVYDVILNRDGSVTYIMSKGQYRKMMDGIAKSVNDNVTEFLSKEKNKEIFKEIVFNKDYSELNVKVYKERYSPFDGVGIIGIEISGMTYQIFNGVENDKISVKTNIMDSGGTIISTSTYPEKK